MSFNSKGERVCDECGEVMREGFLVNEFRTEHYCSKECLNKHYTEEEWDEMYDNGNGDSCYTEWYDELF